MVRASSNLFQISGASKKRGNSVHLPSTKSVFTSFLRRKFCSQQYVTLESIMEVSLNCTKEAAIAIKNIWDSNELGIKEKRSSGYDVIKDERYSQLPPSKDVITKADLKSNEIILKSLHTAFPNLLVVSEEEDNGLKLGSRDCNVMMQKEEGSKEEKMGLALKIREELEFLDMNEVAVFLDPLDGTTGFTKGDVESVTILLGITYYKKPIAGIICQPFYPSSEEKFGRIIYGVVGSGIASYPSCSFVNNNENNNNTMGNQINKSENGGIRLVTTLYHSSSKMDNFLNQFPQERTQIMRQPGAGYKALLVMEGKADVYCYPAQGTNLWDTCAPEACIRALNGKFTDCKGNDIIYSKSSVNNNYGVLCSIHDHNSYLKYLI